MTQREEALIEREAARWVRLMRNEAAAGDELRRSFAQWAQQSADHVRCFLAELAFDEALKGLKPLRQGTRDEWIAELRELASEPTRSAHGTLRTRSFSMVKMALAAAVAIVILGAALFAYLPDKDGGEWRYYAANTQPERVVLEDGSVLEIDRGAALEVRFSPTLREVRLSRGSTGFSVRHEAQRRFLVNVPKGAVEVTGTRFDVRLRGTETEVEVTEGRVRVTGLNQPEPVEVSAGEKTHVTPAGIVEPARHVFRRTTLAEVAARFNSRNHLPKLIVQGTACMRLISAAFNIDDPGELVRDLDANQNLVVTPNAARDTVVIRERGDTTKVTEGQSDCD
jgi:transmembrane sensor